MDLKLRKKMVSSSVWYKETRVIWLVLTLLFLTNYRYNLHAKYTTVLRRTSTCNHWKNDKLWKRCAHFYVLHNKNIYNIQLGLRLIFWFHLFFSLNVHQCNSILAKLCNDRRNTVLISTYINRLKFIEDWRKKICRQALKDLR